MERIFHLPFPPIFQRYPSGEELCKGVDWCNNYLFHFLFHRFKEKSMQSIVFSRFAVGFAIFVSVFTLSFWIREGTMLFLLDSSWSWLVWVMLFAGIVGLCVVRHNISQAQCVALAVCYALTPFAFHFSQGKEIVFYMLPGHIGLAIVFWLIASVIAGFSFRKKVQSAVVIAVFLIAGGGVAYCQEPQQQLVYDWYPPQGKVNFPAVLVIGGSEGGKKYGQQWAKILNTKGFGVMALAYFGVEGLKKQLEEIPLEYFQTALDSLKTFAGVNASKISIVSMSKGTEAALLLAADNPSVKLVIAASPSHVVWQGVNRADYSSVKSSWLKNKQPYPFVHYDYSRGYYPIINFYLGALEKPIKPEVRIPIEKIKGTIVLLSGGKDQIWPSSIMAMEIKNTYSKSNILIAKDFPEAGHGFLIPYQTEEERRKIVESMKSAMNFLGGSVEAFEEAMQESYRLVLAELEKLLKNEK
jgi:hypothetical protein